MYINCMLMAKKRESGIDFGKLHIAAQLTYCNPFTEERIALEKQYLGNAYRSGGKPWNVLANVAENPNTEAIVAAVRKQLADLREGMVKGATLPQEHTAAVRDAAIFVLYHDWMEPLQSHMAGRKRKRSADFARFANEVEISFAPLPKSMQESLLRPAHLYACFFQVLRAYLNISQTLIGTSEAITRLRSRIWQSIFTHDMERFQRCLYNRTADITTLITGPSGSGKELVARAIGLSRFVPYQKSIGEFAEHYAKRFYPLNLSALSPTLIESELFGHRRSAFTGALQDHAGYLEQSGPYGTVFLDEIGETSHDIQVKLLRVLQTRGFQRLGDTELRHFEGKVITATNRDLSEAIEQGNFREDLYYRLCADRIETPSLKAIIGGNREQLSKLIGYVAGKLLGDAGDSQAEAQRLAQEAEAVIIKRLDINYAWPGNFRELEQAMRNIMVHNDYQPVMHAGNKHPRSLMEQIDAGKLTAREVLCLYAAKRYREVQNYEAVGRQLELDRRTVKKYVETGEELLKI